MAVNVRYNQQKYADLRVDTFDARLVKATAKLLALPPGRLLDVGCMYGYFCEAFLKEGWECFGLEASERPAREAWQRKVKAIIGDASASLPFRNESFDAIFAGEIIEHILDTDGFLEECYRVLRPGGRLVLTTPNLVSLVWRCQLLAGRVPIEIDHSARTGAGHVRYYTLATLTSQLRERGFTVLETDGDRIVVPFIVRFGFIKELLSTSITKLLPSLTFRLIIVAGRPE